MATGQSQERHFWTLKCPPVVTKVLWQAGPVKSWRRGGDQLSLCSALAPTGEALVRGRYSLGPGHHPAGPATESGPQGPQGPHEGLGSWLESAHLLVQHVAD